MADGHGTQPSTSGAGCSERNQSRRCEIDNRGNSSGPRNLAATDGGATPEYKGDGCPHRASRVTCVRDFP